MEKGSAAPSYSSAKLLFWAGSEARLQVLMAQIAREKEALNQSSRAVRPR